MKQEAINFIKSMTEQGFLVIVDPEKLNDEDRVIIKVMACKDGDNKAEATLTAEEDTEGHDSDCSVHNEPTLPKGACDCSLERKKKEPGIDLLQRDGRRFRAKIQGVACEGKIRVSDDIDYGVYLCNDQKDNAWNDVDKFGYRGAWFMRTDRSDFNMSITDFELLPGPRVIFTNCVGEVFTEEDKNNDIIVWYFEYGSFNKIYNCKISSLVQRAYKSGSISTDIFRSRKSLLKYLYEACE